MYLLTTLVLTARLKKKNKEFLSQLIKKFIK